MIDFAGEIKSRVTMRDVLSVYVSPVRQHKRIPCPIHHGENDNFSFTDDHFKCWVCGAHGDVITFVQQYFNISFQDAIDKINTDFALGLPIGSAMSDSERDRLHRETQRRLAEKKRRNNIRKLLWCQYYAALDRWIFLDQIKRQEAPKTPLDQTSDEYVFACKRIDQAWAAVEDAQIEIAKFEKELTKTS